MAPDKIGGWVSIPIFTIGKDLRFVLCGQAEVRNSNGRVRLEPLQPRPPPQRLALTSFSLLIENRSLLLPC